MTVDQTTLSRPDALVPNQTGRRVSLVVSLHDRTPGVQPKTQVATLVASDDPRRIAVFVHADIAGYSRLIGQDDIGTFNRLARRRRLLIDPELERYGGKIVNMAGDSLLMEFFSVIAAVHFAVNVQTRMPEYDNDGPADRVIRFRMGINVGDAIPDGANIHGNSVNIAARLQSVCPPGNICVPAVVHDHVPEHLGLVFERIGMLDLKNIANPIEAFIVRLSGSRARQKRVLRHLRVAVPALCLGLVVAGAVAISGLSHPRSTRVAGRAASVLILPFRNASNDAGQQYFADAVTSDVSTDLSRIREVTVLSSATAFTYKDSPITPEQIHQDLGVRYLILGAIRCLDGKVSTNIQLIDATSGEQLWGERFERDFIDLGKLENEIAGRIAASLNVQLVHAEGRRSEQAAVPNALDLRLRATALFFQAVAPGNTAAARKLLTEAVRLDPNSADAWARLAQLTASDYLNHWNQTGREQLGVAEEAVRKALQIDDNLALAHFASGLIHRARGEHGLAIEAFDRTIDLDPNFAYAFAQKADELVLIGRPDEAQPLVEKTIRLSPRDPSLGLCYWFIGRADFHAGKYDRAIAWLRKSVEARRNVWYNQLYLVSAYALNNNLDAARRTLSEFNRLFPEQISSVASVIDHEGTNPANDPTVVAARARFHEGLVLAGMPKS